MKSFKYVITDPVGIHARPAGLLAKFIKGLGAKVTIEANGKSADATKLIAVMGLGIKSGNEITVNVESEAEDAVAKVEEFFKNNL